MLVISEVFPCLGQKMSVYGPCCPVGVSEYWGTELFKDFLIRGRSREFFSLLFKAYAKRSVPSYQENTVHAVSHWRSWINFANKTNLKLRYLLLGRRGEGGNSNVLVCIHAKIHYHEMPCVCGSVLGHIPPQLITWSTSSFLPAKEESTKTARGLKKSQTKNFLKSYIHHQDKNRLTMRSVKRHEVCTAILACSCREL